MTLVTWLKLLILEQRLYHGAFGKYNRYRCLCLKRNARDTAAKLRIAQEVLTGPGVNTLEAQYNDLYVQRHQEQSRAVSSPLATGAAPQAQPEQKQQA